MESVTRMTAMLLDFKFAVRGLKRQPGLPARSWLRLEPASARRAE